MTTYNTGNPIGSTDARDLYDNAQNLDNFANGASASYTDRLGVSRRSLAGIDSAADNVLNSIGYSVPVAYTSGISLTLTSQTVDYNGVVYAPKSSALPFTTSSWGTDSAKFRAIQVTDADLITYTPAGTNAVATTVQRKLRETVSVKDFGAVGDGVTDDLAAFNAAVASLPTLGGGTVYVPAGDYYLSNTLSLNKSIRLTGDGTGISEFTPFSESSSRLLFPAGVNGIDIVAGGAYAIIENIALVAQGKSGYAHGVLLQRRAQLFFVSVVGFSGDGFHINAAGGNNANLWRMEYCFANDNGGNGLYIDGADVNAGTNIGFNATNNALWGIHDSSFLGNHHYGCHVANNNGAYLADSANAAGSFIGCYSENKQWDVLSNNYVIGGSNSVQNLVGAPAFGSEQIFATQNCTKVQRVQVSNFGSGYTSAPTVVIDPPSGATTATASATVVDGAIKKITVLTQGAGYGSPPTVTITDGTGSGATATAYIGKPIYGSGYGQVWMIAVTNGGSGYSSTPTVTIAAPVQTQAVATAIINASGLLTHVVVTNAGSGYTAAPAVSFTGGGGSGAVATAVLSQPETKRTTFRQEADTILAAVDTNIRGTSAATLRWRYFNNNTGDMSLDINNSATNRWWLFSGPFTQQTFGRVNPVPYACSFTNGIWLNDRRAVRCEQTIPPTSGEYARGDIIFARDPSAGGSPGVVCTTGGIAGSTAVFKAMANLAA